MPSGQTGTSLATDTDIMYFDINGITYTSPSGGTSNGPAAQSYNVFTTGQSVTFGTYALIGGSTTNANYDVTIYDGSLTTYPLVAAATPVTSEHFTVPSSTTPSVLVLTGNNSIFTGGANTKVYTIQLTATIDSVVHDYAFT